MRHAPLRHPWVVGAQKATVEEISQLEVRLAQAERAKDLAQFETLEKVQEHEAVKLIRLKQGLVQLSEAYLALANRGALLFEAQRDIAQVMPDAPHHCKYTGEQPCTGRGGPPYAPVLAEWLTRRLESLA